MKEEEEKEEEKKKDKKVEQKEGEEEEEEGEVEVEEEEEEEEEKVEEEEEDEEEEEEETGALKMKVVQKCSRSPTRTGLVPNYNFIVPLTELLLADLEHDKKCVLHILLELTKEMELLCKETSLLPLMSKLTELIMTQAADVARLCLRILVNVCHNNTFLVRSLERYISNRFFRTVMNLHSDSIGPKMEICKLLFVFDPISSVVDGPPDAARTVLDTTFSNFIEDYEKRDIILLNDIVEFFKELAGFPTYMDLLSSYDWCIEYSQNIIRLLERCDYESRCGVFEFMYTLLSVKTSALLPIYPQIVKLSLPWLQTDGVCKKIIGILKTILQNMEDDGTTHSTIVYPLEQHLPNLSYTTVQKYRTPQQIL